MSLKINGIDPLTGAIDWTAPISQPGLPWQGGRSALETRPDLQPEEARGWGAPGKYWASQYLPEVQSSIQRPLRALAALPWRIEEPELPEWASRRMMAAKSRQWALCQRVWWWISQRDRRAFTRLLREVIITAAVEGFYLGEVVCCERVLDFEGFQARYWVPRLPQYRAPWTVRYWLQQHEEPVGVILDASNATDYAGSTGPAWAVLPWRKVVHVAAEQVGTNLEGVSWLRPVYNLIRMMQQTWQVEALGQEVNGVGEMVIKLPEGVATDSRDAATYRQHIQKRKAAQAGGLVVTHGTEVDILSPQNTVPDLSPMRAGLAQSIMLGLNSADQLIAVNGTGAYSAREEATADARDSYDYLAQEYPAAALEQLMDRAIAANYPGDYAEGMVFLPRVGWGNVETRDVGDYVATVALAVGAGLADPAAAKRVITEMLDLPLSDSVSDSGDAVGPGDDAGSGVFQGTAEVAQRFGVRPATIVRWAKKGLIRAHSVGGRYRVDVDSVEDLVRRLRAGEDVDAAVAEDAASES